MFNFFMFLVLLYIKYIFYKEMASHFHMAKAEPLPYKMNIEKPIFWTDLKIDFERMLYFQ